MSTSPQQDPGTEIERKFLLTNIPDQDLLAPIRYERYFLYVDKDTEIRIQKKANRYELERKGRQASGSFTFQKQKLQITQAEFQKLRQLCNRSIIRDSYVLKEHPNITIKVYQSDYQGLIRAEIEFESEAQAKGFIAPEWMGVEITNTPLSRDSQLIALSPSEFQMLLQHHT